jgi:hypothetical protein
MSEEMEEGLSTVGINEIRCFLPYLIVVSLSVFSTTRLLMLFVVITSTPPGKLRTERATIEWSSGRYNISSKFLSRSLVPI